MQLLLGRLLVRHIKTCTPLRCTATRGRSRRGIEGQRVSEKIERGDRKEEERGLLVRYIRTYVHENANNTHHHVLHTHDNTRVVQCPPKKPEEEHTCSANEEG